jgi:hypothetical protein
MSRRTALLLALLAAFSLGIYVFASHLTYAVGFPLDDAWIHQTYARNLAQRGEWAFLPGQPSAGSTGPLWGLLLSLGYAFQLNYLGWAYLLGWLLLTGLGVLGVFLFRFLSPQAESWASCAGVLLVLEWHLVWAAGSGMETLLFALMIAALMLLLLHMEKQSEFSWHNGLLIGCLIGLTIWMRPGGITLLAPAIFVAYFLQNTWRARLITAAWILLGFLLLFGPYLLFNYSVGDVWWPNTFYAKQAEYASHRQIPLLQRWLDQAVLPLVGVGAVLLPGFLLTSIKLIRRRKWAGIAAVLWAAGYLSMYAWRLPVTYQHGRYLIPMMPIFFLWGLAGLVDFLQFHMLTWYWRAIGKAWLIGATLLLLIFFGLGARAYGRDVAVIETEMVTVAHWIEENTPENALIAAHDIGALGFFADRSILDLAGLVSPEVIPFLRDQTRLEAYMYARGADYLVTFPSWYPDLVAGASPVFQTDSPASLRVDHENMAVYPLPIP